MEIHFSQPSERGNGSMVHVHSLVSIRGSSLFLGVWRVNSMCTGYGKAILHWNRYNGVWDTHSLLWRLEIVYVFYFFQYYSHFERKQ